MYKASGKDHASSEKTEKIKKKFCLKMKKLAEIYIWIATCPHSIEVKQQLNQNLHI